MDMCRTGGLLSAWKLSLRRLGVLETNDGHSGRPVSARTQNRIETLRAHLRESPRKSTRRLSQDAGILKTSVI